MAIFTYRECNW
uniref:Uncharacterized protein n=1 Tax=Anguilla anguilla TaxID=7936 RepID=A0A0E9VWC7_ANGAN